VSRLTRAHQDLLRQWLDARQGSTRIIAMSATSLFPDVQSGAFSGDLYYRLNTVTLVLAPRQPAAAAVRPMAFQASGA
jgi:transcriptional regulator of aromatic amino acid metabolism